MKKNLFMEFKGRYITSNKSDINVHFNLQIFLLQPHPIEPFKQDCINQKQVGSH